MVGVSQEAAEPDRSGDEFVEVAEHPDCGPMLQVYIYDYGVSYSREKWWVVGLEGSENITSGSSPRTSTSLARYLSLVDL